MTEFYITLSLIIAFFIIRNTRMYFLARRCRFDELRYNLFAIRDELLKLLMEGKLSEDSFFIREFYPMVNNTIKNMKNINLKALIILASDNVNRMKSEGFLKQLKAETQNAPQEIVELVGLFLATLALTLLHNSFILRVLVWTYKKTEFVVNIIKKVLPLRYNAFEQYIEIERLQSAIKA